MRDSGNVKDEFINTLISLYYMEIQGFFFKEERSSAAYFLVILEYLILLPGRLLAN